MLLRSRSAITVALQPAFFPAPDSRIRHLGCCLRPRTVVDAEHAGQILDSHPEPGCFPAGESTPPSVTTASIPAPTPAPSAGPPETTTCWLTVPAVVPARPEVLKAHHVETAHLHALDRPQIPVRPRPHSGRTVIVRPDTIAGLMMASESTAHRCQRAARELGLELVLLPGRMLTEIESYRARKAGSPQRGLSTVSAFVIPRWLQRSVVHDTPTRGTSVANFVADITTFNNTSGRPRSAPLRSAPHQRRRNPAWPLAKELAERAIFLRKCPPGRIAGQLRRYQTAPLPWRASQLLRAMDAVNVRLGYTSPVRAKKAPWALLAWYLRQIDPVADHPGFTGAFSSLSHSPKKPSS